MVSCVVLCPGQGAQKVGMGKDVAERFAEARAVFDAVDEALGVPLSTLMWQGPEEELTLTHNAQPAILTHSLAVYAVVRDTLTPLAAAGHSLGEFSAYASAGALPVPDAARLVRRRGELMLEAGNARAGTMTVVIGLDAEVVERICADASDDSAVAVAANINAPGQVVISGDPVAVERAGELLKELGAKRVLPLHVSGAFHSPLMERAQVGLRAELDRVAFADPGFPVIANASAEPVTDAATATRWLDEQLTNPVRWMESMHRAAEIAGPDVMFIEIGPGNVLSGLQRRIDKSISTAALGTADQISAFLEQAA